MLIMMLMRPRNFDSASTIAQLRTLDTTSSMGMCLALLVVCESTWRGYFNAYLEYRYVCRGCFMLYLPVLFSPGISSLNMYQETAQLRIQVFAVLDCVLCFVGAGLIYHNWCASTRKVKSWENHVSGLQSLRTKSCDIVAAARVSDLSQRLFQIFTKSMPVPCFSLKCWRFSRVVSPHREESPIFHLMFHGSNPHVCLPCRILFLTVSQTEMFVGTAEMVHWRGLFKAVPAGIFALSLSSTTSTIVSGLEKKHSVG